LRISHHVECSSAHQGTSSDLTWLDCIQVYGDQTHANTLKLDLMAIKGEPRFSGIVVTPICKPTPFGECSAAALQT
jgi:hypothetical protein